MGGNSDDQSFLEACNDFLSGPFAEATGDTAGYAAAGGVVAVAAANPPTWPQAVVVAAATAEAMRVTDEVVTEGIQAAVPDVCEVLDDTFVGEHTPLAESWDVGSNGSSSWGDSSSGGSDSSSSSGDA